MKRERRVRVCSLYSFLFFVVVVEVLRNIVGKIIGLVFIGGDYYLREK